MMGKSLTFIVVGLLSASCRAFQVAPLRTAQPSSRVLIPHASTTNQIRFQKSSALLTAIHQSTKDNDCDVDVESPIPTVGRNIKNAFAKFGSKLKHALNVSKPAASFFLSLSIFLLPFFLLSGFPESASAGQSGGRMGGSFGGGSSSRQSSSRSYSAPRRSSGGGYSGRRSYGAPSRSSGGYSRGYSQGSSSGYYSRPNLILSPRIGGSPFYSPYAHPSGVVAVNSNPFGRIFFIAGLFLFASFVSNIGSNVNDSFRSTIGSNIRRFRADWLPAAGVLGSGVSVAEISVALEVPDRDSPNSILSALDRLSSTARTDSRVGIQNLTSQVAIELLRRKVSIVAASTHASHYRDENKAQREYNNISIQQRGKFQRETLSKYEGVDYSDARIEPTQSEYNPKATVAVVTIVLMIDGDNTSKQLSSNINSIRNVEDALSCIAADAKADNCLRGAEILWTPEERDETLTMRDVLADYSSLRSI